MLENKFKLILKNFVFFTFPVELLDSFLSDGHASIVSFLAPPGAAIATIATDKLTRNMYKQRKPKKVDIATTKN
jgi:hypothetical protein